MEKIIAACGNDCAACPRHLPKTDAELKHTAELWQRIGYRDRVVSNQEIACSGCRPGNWCRYGIVECAAKWDMPNCGACSRESCDRFRECLQTTGSFWPACEAACNADELETLKRAFFEKKENLAEQPRRGVHLPFGYVLAVFEAGLNVDETTFYFADEQPGDQHILGYLPEGPCPDRPYWAGWCDLKDGFDAATAAELFDAPYYDGRSLKERWPEVYIWEIGYIPVPVFVRWHENEYSLEKYRNQEQ